jgi:hypothetical protein
MQIRETVETAAFNTHSSLPYSLRQSDFKIAMEDVYDFSST